MNFGTSSNLHTVEVKALGRSGFRTFPHADILLTLLSLIGDKIQIEFNQIFYLFHFLGIDNIQNLGDRKIQIIYLNFPIFLYFDKFDTILISK